MNVGSTSSSSSASARETNVVEIFAAEAEDEIILDMIDGTCNVECDSRCSGLSPDRLLDRWMQSFNFGVEALKRCHAKHLLFQAGDLTLGGTAAGDYRDRELSIVRVNGTNEVVHWQEPVSARNGYIWRIDRFDNGTRGRVVYPAGKPPSRLVDADVTLCASGVRIRRKRGDERIELPAIWVRLIDMLNIGGGIPPHGLCQSECVVCETPLGINNEEVLDEEESDSHFRYVECCPLCLCAWHPECFRSVAQRLMTMSAPDQRQGLPELARGFLSQLCVFCIDQFDI